MLEQTHLQENNPAIADILVRMRPAAAEMNKSGVIKTAESILTWRYLFNPGEKIRNVGGGGFKLGIALLEFPRMELIPITVYPNVKLDPRAGGFVVGQVTPSGAFPGVNVGSKPRQYLQYPKESIQNVLNRFGENGTQEMGICELTSLSGDTDLEKLEAEILWHAIMKAGQISGIKLTLEELPAFFAGPAKRKLENLCRSGILIEGQQVKVREEVYAKGETMIADLNRSIEVYTRWALDRRSGVLSKSAKELIAANKGQKDNKLQPDDRDIFLSQQFPNWAAENMPDVSNSLGKKLNEQQLRARDAQTDAAVAAQQAQSSGQIDALIEMQKAQMEQTRMLMEENARAREENARLQENLNAVLEFAKAGALSQAAAPPDAAPDLTAFNPVFSAPPEPDDPARADLDNDAGTDGYRFNGEDSPATLPDNPEPENEDSEAD